MKNIKSEKNKTINLSKEEIKRLKKNVIQKVPDSTLINIPVGTIHGNYFTWIKFLPENSIDLLFLDPPYNLQKNFDGWKFNKKNVDDYTRWLDKVLELVKPHLKSTASIYICGDWLSSISIYTAASNHFLVRNRITWEREKGRGAKTNWKNSTEDIWFCTVSNKYTFNLDSVKTRRKVIAPYTVNGIPKDWQKTENGNYRDTHPSNIWTDITIPFWSMPENTEHPTQKSEKLLAKIILCSTNEGDIVFDPFMGSGTTSVTAKKLNRKFLGIERNINYCLLAEKRLENAEEDKRIQGFSEGVFWERNTFMHQQNGKLKDKPVK